CRADYTAGKLTTSAATPNRWTASFRRLMRVGPRRLLVLSVIGLAVWRPRGHAPRQYAHPLPCPHGPDQPGQLPQLLFRERLAHGDLRREEKNPAPGRVRASAY